MTAKLARRPAVDALERSREARGVGEPKARRVLVEGVTGFDLNETAAVEKLGLSPAGSVPGFHRCREPLVKASRRRDVGKCEDVPAELERIEHADPLLEAHGVHVILGTSDNSTSLTLQMSAARYAERHYKLLLDHLRKAH